MKPYRNVSHDEYWGQRAAITKLTGDNFFKKSERYRMNPDLSPKHVGMQWSIVDASELVRPNDAQMREKYSLTQTSFPLFKAYNTFENSGMTYEQRMN